ncbi:uncharacterized protein LOC116199658 isoform X3 [Punica granatum]|uniref:Uncharacterized protein LOC116199658 isoform X3 n=1 Tax=Punica granatum TaxID=22663 RepID=A0A6P8CVB1_PUNGR|nr:uncharacterized protein LOC116199658 isoform X3 [Punica granatum]
MQCTNTFCSSPNHHLPQQKLSILRANQSLAEEQNRTQKRGRASVGSSPKLITSTSNPFVKHCVKLRQSPSYRHSHGSVLVVGTTPIRELNSFQQSLQERTSTMDCLLLLNGAVVPEGLDDHTLPIVRVTPLVMNKLSGVESSESTEAAAVMRIPRTFHSIVDEQKDYEFRRWFPSLHRILVLDGIQDPGNLGTLLRSAVAFNWSVLVPHSSRAKLEETLHYLPDLIKLRSLFV